MNTEAEIFVEGSTMNETPLNTDITFSNIYWTETGYQCIGTTFDDKKEENSIVVPVM